MSCVTMELQENENPTTVNKLGSKIDIEFTQVEEEEVTYQASSEQPSSQNNRKIDDLFYGICYFSFFLGVNFYRDRSYNLRCFSLFIVTLICSLELYFTGYIAYLTLTKPFDAGRVATSISVGTWVLQATLSTLFLAWWQHTSQPCKVLRLLYEANEGLGVYHYRKNLSKIVNSFYFVMAVTVFYYAVIIVTHLLDIKYGYMDDDIPKFFGDRRLFIFVQLTSVYCIVNWVVAIFIFSLLVYATSYEFVCFNDQVRSIKCDTDFESDEAECDYILKLIKTHNRLRECVNHLDHMFHRYAFVMIATIIPTTIFTLFVMLRLSKDNWISQELLLSSPFIFFCVFSFFALVNSPSQLHNTIYSTKSALCANTNIWFPYRANVYHAALAFVCHLDQTHLGVSIWGFAVVSKKLVLTTISVMVTCLALFLETMPAEIWDTSMTEAPVIVEQAKREKDGTIAREQINCSTDNSETDDDYKIDKLFDRICCFGLMLGVNFHGKRSEKARCISLIIVAFHCCINLYFVGYVISLTIRKPFETDRIAATIGICTWVLQALLSTIFLAYWQHTEQPQKILRLLYAANKGVGIHHNRKSLLLIVKSFYAVIASVVCYYVILMICNLLEVKAGYWNSDLSLIFGDRRLFVIVQFSCLYCKLCWAVAIFVYGLLIHAANYEFEYYNEQVRKIECKDVSMPDEALCRYLLSLMKIHTRLTECVKRLDQMFNASFAPSIIYAFVMIATIIPTTIFFSFMIFRFVPSAKNWELLLLSPLIVYCTMSFVALLNAPSRLHNTIYSTKSALCANTYVWFPYRCNVYHSAVAFACHLDQANLGISIWGFAVVSKPLVLTTLSVMTTCLALFLDIGDCSSNSAHRAQTL